MPISRDDREETIRLIEETQRELDSAKRLLKGEDSYAETINASEQVKDLVACANLKWADHLISKAVEQLVKALNKQ